MLQTESPARSPPQRPATQRSYFLRRLMYVAGAPVAALDGHTDRVGFPAAWFVTRRAQRIDIPALRAALYVVLWSEGVGRRQNGLNTAIPPAFSADTVTHADNNPPTTVAHKSLHPWWLYPSPATQSTRNLVLTALIASEFQLHWTPSEPGASHTENERLSSLPCSLITHRGLCSSLYSSRHTQRIVTSPSCTSSR